jgi:hypothetical protein
MGSESRIQKLEFHLGRAYARCYDYSALPRVGGFLPSKRDLGLVWDDEPSHKSRARVAGYFQMSRRDMAELLPMIEKQSCGQFSAGGEKSLVRHYP